MIILLFLFWLILSGQFTLFFIGLGIISILITVFIDKRLLLNSPLLIGFKLSWLIYAFQLFKEMLLSTFKVMKIIWCDPKNIEPGYGYIRVQSSDKLNQLIQASSITLTPGTMTLRLSEEEIFIHALDKEMIKELQQENLKVPT